MTKHLKYFRFVVCTLKGGLAQKAFVKAFKSSNSNGLLETLVCLWTVERKAQVPQRGDHLSLLAGNQSDLIEIFAIEHVNLAVRVRLV